MAMASTERKKEREKLRNVEIKWKKRRVCLSKSEQSCIFLWKLFDGAAEIKQGAIISENCIFCVHKNKTHVYFHL